MGGEEEGALARLMATIKADVDPAIASHRGRIVKTTGDGLLVEFRSAVDAARCSVEVKDTTTCCRGGRKPPSVRATLRANFWL